MPAWASPTDATAHWADAGSLAAGVLTDLLAAAQVQAEDYAPPLARLVTLSTVNTSATVTAATGFHFDPAKDVGAAITGAGIPANATLLAVALDGLTATLSANATATGTKVAATVTRTVPANYKLAVIYQARENRAAVLRGEADVIGVGDYAIRARPLTAQVKALLRPKRSRWTVG